MSIKFRYGTHLHRYNVINIVVLAIISISIFSLTIGIQRQKVSESEAAGKGKDVVFTLSNPSELSAQERRKYNEFSQDRSVSQTQLLRVPNLNNLKNAKSITIPLFDEVNENFSRDGSYKRIDGINTWVSRSFANGHNRQMVIAGKDGMYSGVININNHHYKLKSINKNYTILTKHELMEIDLSDDVLDPNPKIQRSVGNNSNIQSRTSTGPIKVLIVKTSEASTIGDELDTVASFESARAPFTDIDVDVQLVGIKNTELMLANNAPVALDVIRATDDGVGNYIHDWRRDLGAHIVIVIDHPKDDSNRCGLATGIGIVDESDAFVLVYDDPGCGDLGPVMAHEMGHLFGAGHQYSVWNIPGFNHATSVRTDDGEIKSLMWNRIHEDVVSIFSDKSRKIYGDIIFGNALEDNARAIREHSPIISDFLLGGGGGAGGGSCVSYGTSGCGGSCNSVCDCQDSSFSCSDISPTNPGNECWKNSCMVSNPRNRRISGTVLDCSGNPKSGVTVSSKGDFSRTTTTDSQGKFYLSESNNKCSVDLDSGQAFYVVAGKDADANQSDYFGKIDNPVFSQSAIGCTTNVDCNYTTNQAPGGPTRMNYQLVVNAFASTPNVYNAFVCEEDPNYLSGFDFKQKNCPLACNAPCTSDTQCSEANSNWYCASQFSDQSYQDNTSYVSTVSYKSGSDPTIKTETGPTTSINMQVVNGTMQQHLVKNGKLFYRENVPGSGWDNYWTDKTSDISSVGCNYYPSDCGGTIVGFNSYILPNGKKEQNVLRKNNTSSKLFSRNNSNGWSSWVDSTSDVSSVDSGSNSGIVTSFTTYTHKDSYKLQTLVKGGKVYERNNLNGWSSWTNVTNTFNSCTSNSSCGSGTITSIERSIQQDGSDMIHLFRNGKLFSRKSTLSNEVCRLKSKPSSGSCS